MWWPWYSFKWTIKYTIKENSYLFNWHCGKFPPLKLPKGTEGVARLLSGARPRTCHVSQHQFIVITSLVRVWCMIKQWVVFSSNLFQIRQLTYASKSWTIDLSWQVQLSTPLKPLHSYLKHSYVVRLSLASTLRSSKDYTKEQNWLPFQDNVFMFEDPRHLFKDHRLVSAYLERKLPP